MTYQDYNTNNKNIYETTKHFIGSDNESPWIIWNKPANCKLVYFLCIGGGGGGAGGPAIASGTYASGAAPGGGGGAMSMLIPSIFLPNTLYIKPGYCGSAGSGATFSSITETSGGPGGSSFVCYYPDTLQGNRICFANGGNGGAVSSNITPRSIIDGYMGYVSNVFYGNAGIRWHTIPPEPAIRSSVVKAGALAALYTNLSNTYSIENSLCTPGLFGNSCTSAGTTVNDSNLEIHFMSNNSSRTYPFTKISNGFVSAIKATDGLGYGLDISYTGDEFFYNNGGAGVNNTNFFGFCGGAGGYSANLNSKATNAGHGGIGSGGGGGGACGNAISGGRGGDGGKGGPGLISIVCI